MPHNRPLSQLNPNILPLSLPSSITPMYNNHLLLSNSSDNLFNLKKLKEINNNIHHSRSLYQLHNNTLPNRSSNSTLYLLRNKPRIGKPNNNLLKRRSHGKTRQLLIVDIRRIRFLRHRITHRNKR